MSTGRWPSWPLATGPSSSCWPTRPAWSAPAGPNPLCPSRARWPRRPAGRRGAKFREVPETRRLRVTSLLINSGSWLLGRPHSAVDQERRAAAYTQRGRRRARSGRTTRSAAVTTIDGMTTTLTRAAARAVHATKSYGEGDTAVLALDDVTVELPQGRFTAIMGPSGSGKSTLLHCLAGLDSLTSGHVFIGDTDLGRLSDKQLTLLRRTKVGFVFQSFNLVPTLTALENIRVPMTLAGGPADPDWVAAVVETVGLTYRLRHRPSELSGGQQQRVAVARALASKPAIIFADEPTGNLDSRSGADVLGFLQRARQEL